MDEPKARGSKPKKHRRRSPVTERYDSEGRPVGRGGAARQRTIDDMLERMVRGQSTDSNN